MEFHIPFELNLETHRYKQTALYYALREAISSGRLEYGTRLPSSRDLGRQYVLSRGVVNQVYERLAAEGYVEAEPGSGTYIRFRQAAADGEVGDPMHIRLSDWGSRLGQLSQPSRREGRAGDTGLRQEEQGGSPLEHVRELHSGDIVFDFGQVEPVPFPAPEWRRLLYAEVREKTETPGATAPTQGYLPLREAIARHLKRARGITVTADAIVIVNGSMQALALTAQLLLDAGEPAVIENPGYTGIVSAVRAAGGVPVPGQLDGQGLVIEPWDARLAFVTPSRQFPTGTVLSLPRRQALLQWAAERGAVIVEDDYDSEFRHHGRPIEPLKVLDRAGRVVYVGTFSRTMQAQLRIGYAVLPKRLLEPFVRALRLYEPYPASLLEQRALAQFMGSGGYERHMRRMGRVYSRRFELFRRLLDRELGTLFEVVPSDAGLHVFARWRGDEASYERYQTHCKQAGVVWGDGRSYFYENAYASACFIFSHLSEERIEEGVERMRVAAIVYRQAEAHLGK